ncbi:MAG TPA: hypothetical protein VF319_17245, partial [Caldimonas sp.]
MKTRPRKTPPRSSPESAAAAPIPVRNQRPVPAVAPSRQLDVFANPARERDYVIEFVIPEFT